MKKKRKAKATDFALSGTGLPIDPSSMPINNVPQATNHYDGEQLGQTPFE